MRMTNPPDSGSQQHTCTTRGRTALFRRTTGRVMPAATAVARATDLDQAKIFFRPRPVKTRGIHGLRPWNTHNKKD
jgi:hypothetical protein